MHGKYLQPPLLLPLLLNLQRNSDVDGGSGTSSEQAALLLLMLIISTAPSKGDLRRLETD